MVVRVGGAVIMRVAMPMSALTRFSAFMHRGAFLRLKSYLSLGFVRMRRGARGVEFLQFELQRALGDDSLAGFEAFQDGDISAVLGAEFYFAPLELFAREQDVDDLFAFVI